MTGPNSLCEWFINYATKQNGKGIGHDLESCTSEIRAVRCKHPNEAGDVVFVDTPGFDDTYRPDIEILSTIADWLVKTMCGHVAMPAVVLGTTMWGYVQDVDGPRREKQLKDKFWADMIQSGCEVKRFADSHTSAWDIVGDLKHQANTQLAGEIVDDKKRLNETTAGVRLNEELKQLLAKQQETVRLLADQAKDGDPNIIGELEKEKEELEGRISKIADQLGQLSIPFVRRFVNFFRKKNKKNRDLNFKTLRDDKSNQSHINEEKGAEWQQLHTTVQGSWKQVDH
ncbi:hypothetical protein HWV62_32852 [Athelia sp. TMB]|nr:hypothetical protein HWV62_32852 [Athelia sp. TMB]